jgi:hypothetical protein
MTQSATQPPNVAAFPETVVSCTGIAPRSGGRFLQSGWSRGYNDEKCVIERVLPRHDAKNAIASTFKPKGPRDVVRRLSNFDIDGVLSQWCLTNPNFYNWGFNMIDFDREGASLAKYSILDILDGNASLNLGKYGGIIKRPCNIAACVVNTDMCASRPSIRVFAIFTTLDCSSIRPNTAFLSNVSLSISEFASVNADSKDFISILDN